MASTASLLSTWPDLTLRMGARVDHGRRRRVEARVPAWAQAGACSSLGDLPGVARGPGGCPISGALMGEHSAIRRIPRSISYRTPLAQGGTVVALERGSYGQAGVVLTRVGDQLRGRRCWRNRESRDHGPTTSGTDHGRGYRVPALVATCAVGTLASLAAGIVGSQRPVSSATSMLRSTSSRWSRQR